MKKKKKKKKKKNRNLDLKVFFGFLFKMHDLRELLAGLIFGRKEFTYIMSGPH